MDQSGLGLSVEFFPGLGCFDSELKIEVVRFNKAIKHESVIIVLKLISMLKEWFVQIVFLVVSEI